MSTAWAIVGSNNDVSTAQSQIFDIDRFNFDRFDSNRFDFIGNPGAEMGIMKCADCADIEAALPVLWGRMAFNFPSEGGDR